MVSFEVFESVLEQFVPDSIKGTIRTRLAKQIENRVITYKELSERPGVSFWEFDEPVSLAFEPPEYYNELPAEIERLIGNHECHQPFVLEVPDVLVYGRHGFKVTEDGKFIVFNFFEDRGDASLVAGDLAYDIVDALASGVWPGPGRHRSGDPEVIDIAVPLLHRWATNYNHWTEEWLPQIEGLQHYSEVTGNVPRILIPPDPPEFIFDSLETLGYQASDYRTWRGDSLQVRKLILPSVRRCYSDTSDEYLRDPTAIRWVRDRVTENVLSNGIGGEPKRILISREDAASRRILNQAEVMDALGDFGFEKYVLSDLTFKEQVQLFVGADWIVGTHGAGLTNLIYANDASVIELFGDYLVSVYYEMSQYVGHRYGCLRCEADGNDILVDVEELLEAVNRLDNESSAG